MAGFYPTMTALYADVTSTNYDEPIALELVQNTRRCLSLHGCSDDDANGKVQFGGLDAELEEILLEELTLAGIPAEIATKPALNGSDPANICNKTQTCIGAQLEMRATFRESLFEPGFNTRALRKTHTNPEFWQLGLALRKAMNRAN
jgi:phage replication-related protein YjqB (UPF0714/DUF867 family)